MAMPIRWRTTSVLPPLTRAYTSTATRPTRSRRLLHRCYNQLSHCNRIVAVGENPPKHLSAEIVIYRFNSMWCGWRDLNPHGLLRQNLNLVRLPVSPHPHGPHGAGRSVSSKAARRRRERIACAPGPAAEKRARH